MPTTYLKKTEDKQVLVDCYAMIVYLSAEFQGLSYRSTPYYSMLGTKCRYLGVGMMRFFKDEKELEDPEKVKCYPLGIPALITSEPSSIDVDDIRYSKDGPLRHCLVLTFYKGDRFMVSSEAIQNSDACMMFLARLEQGKLDMYDPKTAISMLRDVQIMNKLSLRIPSEEEEIFVVERYRDPDHPGRKARYHTGNFEPDTGISYNSRVESHKATTYSAMFGEDINSGLIASVNRFTAGVRDDPSMAEALFRNMDMTGFAEEEERDRENEAKIAETKNKDHGTTRA